MISPNIQLLMRRSVKVEDEVERLRENTAYPNRRHPTTAAAPIVFRRSPYALEVLNIIRPPRPYWYEELYALAMDKFTKAYEAEIAGYKSRLFASLKGKADTILEISVGTGPNLKYYADYPDVNVIGVDPNRKMEKYAQVVAEKAGLKPTNFKFMQAVAEALPLNDASVDAVVGTLVLCSVEDVDKALQEIRRVLKPGGFYIFVEHVEGKRFNIAADLVEQATNAGELGLAAILVWMRFMATRQLIWNQNYNFGEISKARDRLTDLLQNVYNTYPQYREILRTIMSTVDRGGEGDVGQRIRDEILVVQRKNDRKGGMMEEWHQKLHNNTSPDDVVIRQALIYYIKNDFDVNVYWKTLNDYGITKECLLSYDRAIHSEPKFRHDQKEGLLHDLGNYMRTLKAVHSGADLESTIANCMGYGDKELLQFFLAHIEDNNVESLHEAREELRPLLSKSKDRLKDLLFLDIALDSPVRTTVERGYEELNNASPEKFNIEDPYSKEEIDDIRRRWTHYFLEVTSLS